MSDIAIKIENLSKQYRLGQVGTGTLSHDLRRWWTVNILRKEDPYLKISEINDRTVKGKNEYVWALKDIDLEIAQGESLGIIGKNGAGKSTLLKILSRVTKPTTGAIKYNGRIASLLEVGTGFHFEMTGRENIYMNGSIMGMTKAEITRKFDEIVDFAGVERYIDTPVKRYSSGMTVRLGFAIAAHLDPDILVVDEVLAVGDVEFQKKAIGKMRDVSKGGGRTVLFVSHNMSAIRNICSRSVLLEKGGINYVGDVNNCINLYVNRSVMSFQKTVDLTTVPKERTLRRLVFESLRFDRDHYTPSDDIVLTIILKSIENVAFRNLILSCIIYDSKDNEIFHLSNVYHDKYISLHKDTNKYSFAVKKNALKPGTYYLNLWLGDTEELEYIFNAASFTIEEGNIYHSTYPVKSGMVQPDFNFFINEGTINKSS